MKTEIPASLRTMQNSDPIGTRYTKKPWDRLEYIWFDGYKWQGSPPNKKEDESDLWYRWQEPRKVKLWLNVYPQSVQTAQTKVEADTIAKEGRVARVKLVVDHGTLEE